MSLLFANGDVFATGATLYDYRPATQAETTPRIVLTILVGQYETSAFVDTGGVYFLCSPPLAQRLGLIPANGLPVAERIQWRGRMLSGSLYRIDVTLLATEGQALTINATAFVPELDPNNNWSEELPCVMGLQGCLERLRFAVDPEEETFYFGESHQQP